MPARGSSVGRGAALGVGLAPGVEVSVGVGEGGMVGVFVGKSVAVGGEVRGGGGGGAGGAGGGGGGPQPPRFGRRWSLRGRSTARGQGDCRLPGAARRPRGTCICFAFGGCSCQGWKGMFQ